MIVAERKALYKVLNMIRPFQKVLVAGCGGCVSVCSSGGAREVSILTQEISIARRQQNMPIQISEKIVPRQCEIAFLDDLFEDEAKYQAIVSLGCGVGVQTIVKRFPQIPVFPALDTKLIGRQDNQGVWSELCHACGDCILDKTGGICPIALCSKNLLNGPCGGTNNGLCEIGDGTPCAWVLIYRRMSELGRLKELDNIIPPKSWVSNKRVVKNVLRGDVL